MVGPVSTGSEPLPRQADVAVRKEVVNVLKEAGLTKTGSYGTNGEGIVRDVYTGKDIICTMDPVDLAGTGMITASCGRTDQYKAAAEKLKPFAAVMSGIDGSTALFTPKIADSMVSGYQTARINVGNVTEGGGTIAYFYRKKGGSWVYFKSGQMSPPCSDYNTVDLRNAFKGEACYGANDKLSEVQ